MLKIVVMFKNTSGVRNTSGIKIQVMRATALMMLKGL
jgi:hypothetical protein